MLSLTAYERNAQDNLNKIPLHTHQNGQSGKDIQHRALGRLGAGGSLLLLRARGWHGHSANQALTLSHTHQEPTRTCMHAQHMRSTVMSSAVLGATYSRVGALSAHYTIR